MDGLIGHIISITAASTSDHVFFSNSSRINLAFGGIKIKILNCFGLLLSGENTQSIWIRLKSRKKNYYRSKIPSVIYFKLCYLKGFERMKI